MSSTNNKGRLKTAKGYRLKNSTHNLIEKIQLIINGSKDTVISRAVKLYYIQISSAEESPFRNSKKHKPFYKSKP